MKILYVGQTDLGGTCYDRMTAISRLGHDVQEFNVSKYQYSNRILRSIQWRVKPLFLLNKFNKDLASWAKSQSNVDLIWIDKGVWIYPETIKEIKRSCSARFVHYTPDSQILINRSKHFFDAMPEYDLFVTTKSFEIDLYKKLQAKNVLFVHQSIGVERFRNCSSRSEFRCDIGFISDYKPNYGRVVSNLCANFSDIKIWGPKWERMNMFGRFPNGVVCGPGLWGSSYVEALASFRIGLGLLSKYIPEQHTTRTFEIPAAGTFLLAERTNEHLSFFEEGVEAEFFSSDEEMIDKAKFYLANESARQKIADAGHKRCLTSGYDNDSVIDRILRQVRL